MVQKEYDKLIKSNSIKKLLESIKEDGNSATYLACDVRNYEELKKALDKAVQEKRARPCSYPWRRSERSSF